MTNSIRGTVLVAAAMLGGFPAFAGAQDFRQSALAHGAAIAAQAQASMTIAEWQRQYDAARRRKNAGMTAKILALPISIAGVFLETHAASCSGYYDGGCGRNQGLGLALVWGGIATAVYGEMVFKDGDHEMTRLAMMRPASASGFDVRLGTRPSVGFHLSW